MPGGATYDKNLAPPRPGDWAVMVLRCFGEPVDLVIYRIVQADGDWREYGRASSDQPMPEGVEHPLCLTEGVCEAPAAAGPGGD